MTQKQIAPTTQIIRIPIKAESSGSPIAARSSVARLSGDEFAIIQSSIDQPSDAAALAIRIRAAIREPIDLDGHQVVVDTSIGISIAPNDGTELDELLKTADIALYEANRTRNILFLRNRNE